MTDLYLPGPVRLAIGHKRVRDHMCEILDKPYGTTIFDLGPGSLPAGAWFSGMPTLASVLQRPAVAGLHVPIAADGQSVQIGKFLLKPGVTAPKLFARYLHEWDARRDGWKREAHQIRHLLESQRLRFDSTGFSASDPHLWVVGLPLAADVTVTEVLDLLADGQLPLGPWRQWLQTVCDMEHRAPDESSREARLRWHIAEVCQRMQPAVLDALEHRFGVEGERWTLEQCGRYCDITRERVRQVEEAVRNRIGADRYLSDAATESCVAPRWRSAA